MADLDELITRIRALPADRQAEAARRLSDFLEEEQEGSLLTDAQWAEVKARTAAPGVLIEHDEVVAAAHDRYGA